MDVETAMNFVRERRKGVVIALKRDGRPQASNILYAADGTAVRISVTATRAKTHNLQRDPRASLHVTSDDFWHWVVVEGTASFSPVATADDRATLRTLRQLYRDIQGEHNDWDDYDRAMVDEQRMMLTIDVESAYGQLPAD